MEEYENSKFSEVQIIKILSEQNQGKTVNEICREHGICQKELSQYKKIVAELTLENVVIKAGKITIIVRTNGEDLYRKIKCDSVLKIIPI
ncbi:transposase [Chryseobacterium sp. JK1]|uniref:transposase n=1 Tax=Chryseobacterium sp. JK1 TaxID=874294 RepID=UPI003D69E010